MGRDLRWKLGVGMERANAHEGIGCVVSLDLFGASGSVMWISFLHTIYILLLVTNFSVDIDWWDQDTKSHGSNNVVESMHRNA